MRTGGRPHIVYAFDGPETPCLLVSLVSALRMTDGPVKVSLHPTAADDRTVTDIASIARAFPHADLEVEAPDPAERPRPAPGTIPSAGQTRLLLPDLHRDRLISLTPTTLVRKSLLPLWNTDLRGACLGAPLCAVTQTALARSGGNGPGARRARDDLSKLSHRLEGIDPARYVDTQVMVLDLDRIRALNLHDQMRDLEAVAQFARTETEYLNMVFRQETTPIDPTWSSALAPPGTVTEAAPTEMRDTHAEGRHDPAICTFPDMASRLSSFGTAWRSGILAPRAARARRKRLLGELAERRAEVSRLIGRPLQW